MLSHLLLAISMAVAGQGPGDAFSAALGDLATAVPPEKQPYTRYLSLAGVPGPDRPRFLQALSFSLNSTHFRKQILPLTVVNGYLVRLDLTEFGWDKESRAEEIDRLAKDGVKFDFKGNAAALARFTDIWEDIARIEPYHASSADLDKANGVRGWIDPRLAAEAANLSHSGKFVISASWLYPRLWVEAADGGFYSQLLLFPTSEQALLKRLGIDIKTIEERRGLQGAAIIGPSLVAFHNRELQELASPIGPDRTLWRTSDFSVGEGVEFDKDGVDTKNVLESLANTARLDGREIIGSLPDGLHFYYLCDGKGKQVNVVPQAIALDRRPEGHDADRNVRNAYMCVSCHGPASGIYPFEDSVKAAILSQPIALGVYAKDRRKLLSRKAEIEEFYLPGLGLRVGQQQASYKFYVFTATGMDPGENSLNVVGLFDRYFWDLVTPQQAALEMGVPLPAAIAWWRNSISPRTGLPNQNLMILVSGKAIRRAAWESAIGDAMRGKPGGYPWEQAVRPVQAVVPVQVNPAPAYAPPGGYRPR